MIKIALMGALGKMGNRIGHYILEDENCELAGLLDNPSHPDFGKEYSLQGRNLGLSPGRDLPEGTEVVIDFSSPGGTMASLEKCLEKKIPLVSGTTGLSDEELQKLKEASSQIPLLHSTNMSLGVNLLRRLVREASRALKEDFDIELVELHHHHKVDAPSGTCMTLYEDICHTLDRDPKQVGVYGRKGKPGPRTKEEIGLHALRLGGVVGEHTVYFCSEAERIELKHQAHSRDVFAKGAVRAAKWMAGKAPGFYTMEDVLFGG